MLSLSEAVRRHREIVAVVIDVVNDRALPMHNQISVNKSFDTVRGVAMR